ncbi:hypothetical protein A2U01_0078916, partial [Trifolium medium]|nr:hypothetical protein [Trifolium medium]
SVVLRSATARTGGRDEWVHRRRHPVGRGAGWREEPWTVEEDEQ